MLFEESSAPDITWIDPWEDVPPPPLALSTNTDDATTVSELVITAFTGGFGGGTSGGMGWWEPLEQVDALDPMAPPPLLPTNWANMPEEVLAAFCAFASLVEGLDGMLLYGSDGDGVDEAFNIMTAVSIALGVGGVAALGARAAVNTGPVLNALGAMFGDDIALRLAPALGQLQTLLFAGAASGGAMAELMTALTNGDAPSGCGGHEHA